MKRPTDHGLVALAALIPLPLALALLPPRTDAQEPPRDTSVRAAVVHLARASATLDTARGALTLAVAEQQPPRRLRALATAWLTAKHDAEAAEREVTEALAQPPGGGEP